MTECECTLKIDLTGPYAPAGLAGLTKYLTDDELKNLTVETLLIALDRADMFEQNPVHDR